MMVFLKVFATVSYSPSRCDPQGSWMTSVQARQMKLLTTAVEAWLPRTALWPKFYVGESPLKLYLSSMLVILLR